MESYREEIIESKIVDSFNQEFFDKEAVEFNIDYSDLIRVPIQKGSEPVKDISQIVGGTFRTILPGDGEEITERSILDIVSSGSYIILDRPLID